MASKVPWSAAPPVAVESAEAVASHERLETPGSPGTLASDRAGTDVLLVHGKSSTARGRAAMAAGGGPVAADVFLPDERVRITATNAMPWRMIAALEIAPQPPRSGPFMGTAWLIGPRTLLTAGHCVKHAQLGGWAARIDVSPARNGPSRPHGTLRATAMRALDPWVNDGDPDFDIGCLEIDTPLGNQLGYFPIASLGDGELTDALVNISGYPVDRGSGTEQYFHANRVKSYTPRRLFYDVDTYGGQSGSPVWHQAQPASDPVVVGVHAYGLGGGASFNSAPRITPEVVETVREWLSLASS